MSRATLAWAAFKNMLRAAARDPLWAFVSLLTAPFRIWKPLLGILFILIMALFVVGFGGHAADQFFKVAFAGVQDGAAVVGVHAEHQPFTVGVEQH